MLLPLLFEHPGQLFWNESLRRFCTIRKVQSQTNIDTEVIGLTLSLGVLTLFNFFTDYYFFLSKWNDWASLLAQW